MGKRQLQKYPIFPDGEIYRIRIILGAGMVSKGQSQPGPGHGGAQVSGNVGVIGNGLDPGLLELAAAGAAKNGIIIAENIFKGSRILKFDPIMGGVFVLAGKLHDPMVSVSNNKYLVFFNKFYFVGQAGQRQGYNSQVKGAFNQAVF